MVGLLLVVSCGRRSPKGAAMDFIEYDGKKVALSRSYSSYEEYRSDPEHIPAFERDRVRRLVLERSLQRACVDVDSCLRVGADLQFPGYGISGFGNRVGETRFIGQAVEVPYASEDRIV